METMHSELAKKELRGVNLRLVIQLGGIMITACSLYYGIKTELANMRSETSANKELLLDIKQESKEQARLNNDRMTLMESKQREIDLRLTVLETELKDHK